MLKYFSPSCPRTARRCLVATLMLGTAIVPATAYAQSSDDPSAETTGLGEIVVTARKREENLQQTPVAITALTSQALLERNVQSTADITNFAPNIQFDPVSSESGGGASSQISIRGIGQTDWTITVEPGVGLYLDGIYVGKSVGSLMDAVDLDSIQVLRGPQGTLFGKNTIGGAVVINSKRPSDKQEFLAEATIGTYNRFDVGAVINVPVSDTVRVRASGAYKSYDGHVKRVLTGDRQGNKNAYSGRIAAEWDVTPDLLATVAFDGSTSREETPGQIILRASEDGFFAGFHNSGVYPLCNPATPGNTARFSNPDCWNSQYVRPVSSLESTNTGPNRSDTDVWGTSLTLNYSGDDFGVKSITAYRNVNVNVEQELAGSRAYYNIIGNFMKYRQFTQELQVTNSLFDDRLKTLFGGFFATERGSQIFPVILPAVDFTVGGRIRNESYAAFGQASFDITSRTSLTVGARYSVEDKKYSPAGAINDVRPEYQPFFDALFAALGNGFLVQEGTPILPAITASLSDRQFTPMVTLDHKFSDEVFGYISYSSGFKGGGFTIRGFPPIIPGVNTTETDPNKLAPSFEPETADVFEAGFKTQLFENRVRLNIAAFLTTYKDIQLIANVGVSNFVPVLINAGDGEIWGIEGEFEAVVTDSLRINGGFGYQNSKYTRLSPESIAAGTLLNFRLPNAPEFSANGGVTWNAIETESGKLSLRGDVSYKSSQAKTSNNDPATFQKPYTIANASMTYTLDDKSWSFTVGVTNITDKIYINSAVSNNGIGYAQGTVNRPREVYARARFGF